MISSEQDTCWRDDLCKDVCIFVDDIVGLPLPQTTVVHIINPAVPQLEEWIIQNVEMAHKTVFERVYQQGEK